MKPYADNPMTPKMRGALKQLARCEKLVCGRPTKQRLAKFGLAKYIASEDPLMDALYPWDRDMVITDDGIRALGPINPPPKRPEQGGRP